jgi:integrase
VKGHIEQRGEKWVVVINRGLDEKGIRRRNVKTCNSLKEAEKLLVKRLRELDTGTYAAPTKQTVAKFLEAWLNSTARMRVSGKTWEAYSGWIRGRIVPALGHHRLDALTPAMIEAAWAQLLQADRKDGKAGDGLSPKSVLHCHSILRAALGTAVRQGVLARNPCDSVDPPRQRKPETLVLTVDQINRLLDAARDTRACPAILLAVTVALRRGEALALRWVDVDFDTGAIVIRRATEQTKGRLVFKEPKSGRSRRIHAPRLLLDELRRHKARQAEQRLRFGPDWQDHALVCANADGTPCSPTAITQEFCKLVRRLEGFPPIRFHDLRHSCATLLLSRGVPVKVVSEILGHSTAQITLDRYGHLLPTLQAEAAAHIDDALRGAV